MPSKTWYASKDARIAHRNSDGWDAGAGKDSYLPVGLWQGYVYRSLIDFSPNWDGVTKIVSAKLKLKTSGQHYVGFGSDPDILVQRLTESWSEGTSTNLSSSNAVTYANQPSATSTSEVTKDITTSEGTWVEIDITDMIDDIAPTGVTRSDGTAGSGSGGINGIRLRAVSEGSSGDTTEFYSRESGSDPRIVLSYISNTTPSAPQWVSPGSGAIVADLSPDLVFDGVDADGDNPASYEIQIDTTSANGVEPDWASLTWASGSGQTSGIVGKRITRTAGGTLARGQWYAARARTTDSEGETGPWAIRYFKINSLPTATPSSPTANGLALIHNIGEAVEWTSGGSHAKPRLDWTYSDADGHGQIAYQLQLGTDGINADIGDTGEVASSATFHDATNGVPNGTTRYWRVRVKDSAGEWSAYTSWTAFKVRWGQAIYEYAPSGGSNTAEWEFSSSPEVPANTQKAFAFRTATGASGAGAGSWVSDIGALTPNTYLNVLVRLATYGSGTNSTLPDMTFGYLGSGVLPDNWTVLNASIALDPSVRRFGTQSLRVTTAVGVMFLYPYWKTPGDDLPCLPNTEYTLSAWVKTDGALSDFITFRVDRGSSGEIFFGPTIAPDTAVTDDTSAHPEGWQRIYMTFTTLPGMTVIRPMIWHNGVGGERFWVDAFQLEEGSVASAWSPGFVGSTTLDSGGVAVDGSMGGIFRLRGNVGGARDIIQLGDNGLIFGGDVEVYSDVIGELTIDGDLNVTGDFVRAPQTYTVTVSGGGTATFSTSGRYVEFGDVVFLHVDISVASVGSGASLVTFNLPVASAGGTNQTLSGWIVGLSPEAGPAVCQIGPSATSISAIFSVDGTTLTGAELDSTSGRLRFTGLYFKA